MTTYPPIFLLRHGQTEWNLALRLQGSLDSPLTALGEAQAAGQGRLLSQILVHASPDVVVSPLGRTRQTAKIALRGHDLAQPVRFDARIAEINAGEWEGIAREEIARRWPDAAAATCDFDYYTHAAGGEGYDGLHDRCQAFLAELTRPTIVITHGICSVMLRGLLCDLTYEQMCQLPLTQGCIFEVRDGKEVLLQEAK
jgi:probable phosphoglycerate mutase